MKIIQGDCLEILPTLEAESVQMCCTSPPYYGLRDYQVSGQLGLESTLEEYLEKMVAVFREVKRVLRSDGTCWLNMGDSYVANRGNTDEKPGFDNKAAHGGATLAIVKHRKDTNGLKEKDLMGVPWRLAFALQADGWYLRQDIIWHKPNPMPESVTDRCTKAHEYIFLLTKSQRYFYDAEAVKEDSQASDESLKRAAYGRYYCSDGKAKRNERTGKPDYFHSGDKNYCQTRNRRSVWTITTKPFSEAHFATFPPEIPEICIKAGSREGDTILDPFSGAGTTGLVAEKLGREFIGIELNPEYVKMAEKRIAKATAQGKLF